MVTMQNDTMDSKRRSVTKSLIWRLIGVVWTWVGAYIILLLVPEKYASAAIIATLIVVYHHTTRMVMYYFYERLWSAIKWGRADRVTPLSIKAKLLWISVSIIALIFILYLIIYITPIIKG